MDMIFADEDRALAELGLTTCQAFKKRAAEIADHAHNSRGAVGGGVDFLRGLDETERQCRLRPSPGCVSGG